MKVPIKHLEDLNISKYLISTEPLDSPLAASGRITRDSVMLNPLRISREFELQFKLTVNTFVGALDVPRNILRLTNTLNDKGSHGDRILLLMVQKNLTVTISSSIGDDDDYEESTATSISFNVPVNVTVLQIKDGNTYKRQLFLDGTKELEVVNPDPQEFEDVTLYLSDPHHRPVDGNVQDFLLSTGKHDNVEN